MSKAVNTSASRALQTTDLLSPGGDINAYLQAISSIPLLSTERERELAMRLKDQESIDAARELVLSHLRFVAFIARSYRGYGLPIADLIQEGNIGLMKAVKRFDPTYKVRLITFAVHWIKAEIHKYVLQNWRIVKMATTKAQRKLFFNLRRNKKRLEWLTQDEARVIAKELDVTPEEVLRMEESLSSKDISFDVRPERDDGNYSAVPAEYLESSEGNPALLVESDQLKEKRGDALLKAFSQLDDRSRDILQSRWLMPSGKVTLQELANKYQVSVERVRQIEQSAMKKVRAVIPSDIGL